MTAEEGVDRARRRPEAGAPGWQSACFKAHQAAASKITVILVDTSIWIQHLRSGHEVLAELLDAGSVVLHPFVLGELVLGNLSPREVVLNSLQALPQATVAMHEEVLDFIETNALYGLGIGYVDAHLLASVRLSPGALLWTRDKRLQQVAERFGLAWRS
jgi:predicted nucleic acid-binding protein